MDKEMGWKGGLPVMGMAWQGAWVDNVIIKINQIKSSDMIANETNKSPTHLIRLRDSNRTSHIQQTNACIIQRDRRVP